MRRIEITPHSPPHGLARAVLCACVLLLLMCGNAAAWLDGYDYRQQITLTGNASGAQTDYQLLLNVTYDAHMQANFSDLRFTNASDVLIDAWLESNTTDYALVWVEFPTTPANGVNQTYYMYYGNVGAASDWDGGATFLMYSDGTNVGSWTDPAGILSNVSGEIRVQDSTSSIYTAYYPVSDLSIDMVLESRFKNVMTSGNHYLANYLEDGNDAFSRQMFYTDFNIYRSMDGGATINLGAFANNMYYRIKTVVRISDTLVDYYYYTDSNVLIGSDIDAVYYVGSPTQLDKVHLYTHSSRYTNAYISHIFLRKYAANPPTAAFGSEQGNLIPVDIVNGIYGFLNASIPSNSTIAAYKAAGVVTIESTLDWDAVTSGTWDSYLASVQYCYDQNRRSAMRLDLGGDYNSSAYRESVKVNITAYLPDLSGDPHQSTLQYIVLNLTNASGVNTMRTAFVNEIGQNISEQTGNSFKTMILEDLQLIDQVYVGGSPILYKSLTTVPDWLDFEAETLRGNTSLSRVYSGNESFITNLTDYRENILNRMRDTSNTSNQYNETYSVMVGDGDIILFNNGSAKVNRTVADAPAGYYWAAINDTLMNLSAGAGTVGFYIPARSYDYILKESSLDRIIYISDQSSQLWAGETTVDEEVKYHDGIMDASYTWGGDNTDIRAEFWDPAFTRENTFMIHYEWINASIISDYSVYDYIIIADKNANEITNTIARLSDTYGYVSVGDYMDTDGWQAGKVAEIDDWCDNFSVNIFLDGIDSATLGVNASIRLKDLADHVRDDKDKKIIMNTYTYYQEFATYGDAVMKESCFSRWGGSVNSPTYTWENMTIEKERADYYTSQNIPVLGMSFGDVGDYDKMAFDYAAFSVLYGLTGDNSYRYGQPNFQAQKEIMVYPLGTMLEPSYTETSDTDWNRLYQAGRVHINPEDHTWWVDDNKDVNNLTVDVHFYAGGNFGGGQHVKVFANSNESISTIYYYNSVDPLYTWVWRSCELDKSAYADHGHYYVYMYYRGISGGWNFLGEATQVPAGNVKTWFDTTTQNLPETTTGQSWGTLAGYNWMMNLTVNYTTSAYVDELTDRIAQTPTATLDGYTITHQTTISSDRDTAIPVWSGTRNISAFADAKTYLNDSTGNWVEVGVNDIVDATGGVIDWNLTTVDGEQYGVVRESRGNDMYLYRFLLPHASIHTFKTNSSAPVPPDPTTLANTTGNHWVNHTWQAGSGGNTTDSYSVLVNVVWHNGTTNTFYNDTYTAHAWQNITVYAFNSSGTGTLSFGNITDSIQIPNNPVTITNTSDWSGEMGENVYVCYNATDLDNDTITYSCNRTDLFTDFSTANGTGNWIAAPGTFYIDFGVSDGWGSTDNYTMTIIANATPPDPTTLANTTGNFWVNHTWAAGSGNVSESYNASVNGAWHNTTPAHYNDTYTAHAWQNITVYAFNSSGIGTLSAANVSQDTQIPNNPITITNTSDWSGDAGNNVYVDYDATDADSDTPTFSCNRTDLFTDFSTANGTGNWTATPGTFYIDFGVSDGWGSSSNYTMTLNVTAAMTLTLLSQDPATLFQNSTGTFNQTWGINHFYPLNNSTITYIYHNIADSDPYHSLRMPINDRAPTGWRGDNRNESGAERMTMEGNTTVFGSDIWTWSGKDLNSTRMTIEVINSTYAKIHINCTVQCLTTSNSWYLNRKEMQDSAKTQIDIDKGQTWLVKFFDPEVLAGRDTNYTASFWIDTMATASAPPASGDTLYIYYANGSFDPTGGVNIKDSPYGGLLGSLNYTEWLDHKYTANQSKYSRFDVYAGRFPEIALDTEMYVYFEFDSPKKFKMNVTDVATATNLTFGETGVLWTGTLTGSTYTASPYTPNLFMTFHRGNQTFESRLWAMDSDGNLISSNMEQTPITQSEFPPTAPTFHQFTFAGHNDTTMDCTYRDNITIWLDPGSDPDGGNTTTNLTLWTADKATCVEIINATIPGGSGTLPIVLNTTPHYSNTTLYTLRGVVTDDESSSTTRWLPVNFALSPLGTTGAFVDGDRVTFWGLDDLPALYTAISDPTAISLSGGTYTFHKAFHHSQYGDLWNVSSDIRIISTNDPGTPHYRLTGTDDIDGATIIAWNETTGAPAQITEEYRAYLYSDVYYSRIDIMNSNISYFGQGISPYRGVYIQNGEGAIIDNNTFLHNGYGLTVLNGGNFTISNNTVQDPTGHSISISDTNGNVTIRDNIVGSDVETRGISMIQGGSGNEFTNNTVTGQAQSGFYNRYISNSTFRDNIMNNVQNGIVLSINCSNITIINNEISVKMDEHGHPAWGIVVMSGTHNITDNTVQAQNGYGIVMSNFYPDIECKDTILINNSVTTNTGTHTDAGAFADYVFEVNTTGNLLRNPADTTNSISITDAGSDVHIENTDNAVFSEDSVNDSYAYPTNFSLFADTQELFNITQHPMTATPATDRLRFWNLEWGTNVTFNASTDTAGNQVWFNATKSEWADTNVSVYRNGSIYYNGTADASGLFAYNYSGGWSERYFAFVRGNLAPDKPTLVAPANGATGTSTNPTLRVTVTDPDADPMSVTFYQQGGTQIGSTQTGIANGSTASVVWSGRSYSTTYYWYAVADDGNLNTQSDTWHFTTQATGGGGGGGGVTHDIAITGCTDWNGNAGTQAYIDFGYVNEDADSPVFSTNATNGTLNNATGVWTWATGAGDVGVYNWWFRVKNAYGNSDDCTVTVTVYTPDTPLNLDATTGNFWIDHTWNAVAGASGYNVSINGAWHNGTATHYLNTLLSPHGWSNITLAAYNASTGESSFISDDVQLPNNPITITNYSDQNVFVGDNVTVDLDYADLDGDTPTFSCSRTDLFTDFNTTTGTGTWTTATNGTYEIDFGGSDGWGSVSNCTMTVRVGERPTLPTTIPVSIWIVLTVLMFGFVIYTLHVKGYVQKIFGGMISVIMAYIQSQQIVSGNVVQITSLMSSTDVIVTEKVEVVIPELAYLLLFVAVIMSLVTSAFIMKYIQYLYKKANAIKEKEDDL